MTLDPHSLPFCTSQPPSSSLSCSLSFPYTHSPSVIIIALSTLTRGLCMVVLACLRIIPHIMSLLTWWAQCQRLVGWSGSNISSCWPQQDNHMTTEQGMQLLMRHIQNTVQSPELNVLLSLHDCVLSLFSTPPPDPIHGLTLMPRSECAFIVYRQSASF